jgi:hypothetical protein
MCKGDFFVVDYKISHQGAGYSEILPSDKIRCPNTKYIDMCSDDYHSSLTLFSSCPVTDSTFKRMELAVTKDIQEVYEIYMMLVDKHEYP